MKKFLFVVLVFITIADCKATLKYNNGLDTLVNYCPLEINNKYQYITITYDLPSCYWVNQFSIVKDSIINQNKYFLVNNSWQRIDSTGKLFIYLVYNNTEILYMDFSLDAGQFLNGTEIITGTTDYFGTTIQWKGFKYTSGDYSKKWAYGIGDIYTYQYLNQPGTGGITKRTYLMQFMNQMNDSIINYSHSYYPEITYNSLDTIEVPVIEMDIQVDHIYSMMSGFCSRFQFIEKITIESFYKYQDSLIMRSPYTLYSDPNSINFHVNLNLDTTLINKGFDFYYRIQAKDKGIIPHFSYKPDSGFYKIVYTSLTDVESKYYSLPTEYKLEQNYPNPFNPSTKIIWQSPVGSWQTLKVFDVLGREVATLVDEFRNVGNYEVEFDASNITSGVYYYQLRVAEFIETKKMILIK